MGTTGLEVGHQNEVGEQDNITGQQLLEDVIPSDAISGQDLAII